MKNEPILISIGLPVCNGETYLPRAIDSILKQSYREFELIISDNSSDDNTRKIIQIYAKNEERIHVFSQPNRIPIQQNFKFVLDQARGSFFMWAAYDDFWSVDYLFDLLTVFQENPGCELAVGKVIKVSAESGYLSEHLFPDIDLIKSTQLVELLKSTQSAWIYGLFRIENLRRSFSLFERCRSIWGADLIFLLHFVLNGKIRGSDRAVFSQMKTRKSAILYKPRLLKEKLSLFFRYMFISASELAHSNNSFLIKLLLFLPVIRYLRHKVFALYLKNFLKRDLYEK